MKKNKRMVVGMKKLLIVMMTALLIVSLFGCKDTSSANDESSHEADFEDIYSDMSAEELAEVFAASVQITINPEFKLFLDEEDVIVAVKCLNQDAKDLYPELKLLGRPYEEGFEDIVEKAIQKNFITDGSCIQVEICNEKGEAVSQETHDHIVTKSNIILGVVSYNSDFTINLAVKSGDSVAVPPMTEEPGQNTNQNEEPEWPIVEEEKDANGNVIKKTITDDGGNYIHIYEYTPEGHEISDIEHFPDGTVRVNFSRVYHGTNPLSYTETNEFGDVYDIICDAEGKPEKKSFYTPDGELIEHWLDGEMVTRERWAHKDGNITDVEFDNHIKVKETNIWADGTIETYIYQNEVLVSKVHESTLDDGRRRKSTSSYVGGNLAEEIISLSDGVVEITRYANGVKTFYSYEFADGTYDRRTYNGSGLLIYQESYIAAWGESHNTTYTVGGNGKYTYSIYKSNDGFVEEVFYDAAGNKASWKILHTDGRVEQGIFDANGKYIR